MIRLVNAYLVYRADEGKDGLPRAPTKVSEAGSLQIETLDIFCVFFLRCHVYSFHDML
jgi:hypothetical protein